MQRGVSYVKKDMSGPRILDVQWINKRLCDRFIVLGVVQTPRVYGLVHWLEIHKSVDKIVKMVFWDLRILKKSPILGMRTAKHASTHVFGLYLNVCLNSSSSRAFETANIPRSHKNTYPQEYVLPLFNTFLVNIATQNPSLFFGVDFHEISLFFHP